MTKVLQDRVKDYTLETRFREWESSRDHLYLTALWIPTGYSKGPACRIRIETTEVHKFSGTSYEASELHYRVLALLQEGKFFSASRELKKE